MITRQVSSMIHSARPTVSPVANIVFAGNLFCFEKLGLTDGRPWLWAGRVDQKYVLSYDSLRYSLISLNFLVLTLLDLFLFVLKAGPRILPSTESVLLGPLSEGYTCTIPRRFLLRVQASIFNNTFQDTSQTSTIAK